MTPLTHNDCGRLLSNEAMINSAVSDNYFEILICKKKANLQCEGGDLFLLW